MSLAMVLLQLSSKRLILSAVWDCLVATLQAMWVIPYVGLSGGYTSSHVGYTLCGIVWWLHFKPCGLYPVWDCLVATLQAMWLIPCVGLSGGYTSSHVGYTLCGIVWWLHFKPCGLYPVWDCLVATLQATWIILFCFRCSDCIRFGK